VQHSGMSPDSVSSLDAWYSYLDARYGYRLQLRRALGGAGPRLGWIMLNPSTADGQADDPTIRRVRGFSEDWGAGELEVVNLFPLRATRPEALLAVPESVRLGPQGLADAAIAQLCAGAAAVVLAWGAQGARYPDRVRAVLAQVAASNVQALCLGLTAGGQPRHPLYVPKTTALRRFEQREAAA